MSTQMLVQERNALMQALNDTRRVRNQAVEQANARDAEVQNCIKCLRDLEERHAEALAEASQQAETCKEHRETMVQLVTQVRALDYALRETQARKSDRVQMQMDREHRRERAIQHANIAALVMEWEQEYALQMLIQAEAENTLLHQQNEELRKKLEGGSYGSFGRKRGGSFGRRTRWKT